jgi:hypothetical protein
MNTCFRGITLGLLTMLGLLIGTTRADADSHSIDADTYAAVAFSKSTGKYGYSWNQWSRARAESEALSECKADDAKIVGWVKFGWLVLVVGEGNAYAVGWEYGDGASRKDAVNRAAAKLKEQNCEKMTTLVILCSGNVKPLTITSTGPKGIILKD